MIDLQSYIQIYIVMDNFNKSITFKFADAIQTTRSEIAFRFREKLRFCSLL